MLNVERWLSCGFSASTRGADVRIMRHFLSELEQLQRGDTSYPSLTCVIQLEIACA